MAQRWRRALVVMLLLTGILGVVIGELLPEGMKAWRSIATFGGSALFGASLPMIMEEFLGTETRDIWHYLTAREKFDSAPDYIDTVTGTWNVYYLTKAEGKRIWKYVRFGLAKTHGGQSIIGANMLNDAHGDMHNYTIEGGIRGRNLILIFRAKTGAEDDAVIVLPTATRTNLSVHVGLEMLETWDGDSAISLSLYSRRELLPQPPTTEADYAKLDEMLTQQMKASNIVNLAPNPSAGRVAAPAPEPDAEQPAAKAAPAPKPARAKKPAAKRTSTRRKAAKPATGDDGQDKE